MSEKRIFLLSYFSFRKKKALLLLFFLTFLWTINHYSHEISSFAIGNLSKASVKFFLNKELSYESIQWEKEKIVIKDLALINPNNHHLFLTLDQAEVAFFFHPFSQKKKIKIDLHVCHPKFFLENKSKIPPSSSFFPQAIVPPSPPPTFFWDISFIDWKIQIDKGTYQINSEQKILDEGKFAIEMADSHHPTLFLFDPASEKEMIKIDLFEQEKEKIIFVDIHQGSIKKLSLLSQCFFPKSFSKLLFSLPSTRDKSPCDQSLSDQSLAVQSQAPSAHENLLPKEDYWTKPSWPQLDGSISGSIMIGKKEHHISRLTTSLFLEDLILPGNNKNTFFLKHLSVETFFSSPFSEKNNYFGFFNLPKDFKIHLCLEEGKIQSNTPEETIDHINGCFSFNNSSGSKWEIKGKTDKNFLCFQGKGFFQSPLSNWIKASLTFDEKNSTNGCFLEIHEDQQKRKEIQAKLQMFEASCFNHFSFFIQKLFPDFADWKLSQGTLSCQICAHYDSKQFYDLNITDLSLNHFHLTHPSFLVSCGWESLSGQFQTDFSKRGVNASFTMDDSFTNITLPNATAQEILSNLSGKIEIKKGEITQGKANFSSHKMKGDLQIAGLFDNMKISCSLQGTENELAELFSIKPKETFQPFQAKFSLDTDLHKTYLRGDSIIGDEQKLIFNLTLDHSLLYHLKNPKSILTDLSHLQLDGEKINLDRCFEALPFLPTQITNLKGSANLHGTLVDNQFHVSLQGHSISYVFPEMVLTLEDASSENEHSWEILYDWKKGDFTLNAPQIIGSCYFSKIKKTLSIFRGSGKMEKNQFTLSSVSAMMDQMNVEGDFFYEMEKNSSSLHFNLKSINGKIPKISLLGKTNHPLPLPSEGEISGSGDLFCNFSKDHIDLSGYLGVSLSHVFISINDSLQLEDSQAQIYADFSSDNYLIENLEAKIKMDSAQTYKELLFRAPILQRSDETGKWLYDFRIEDDFHELCRLKGSMERAEELFELSLDSDHSHLLDVPIKVQELAFDRLFSCRRAKLSLSSDYQAFHRQLEFFLQTGLFPLAGNLTFLPKDEIKATIQTDFSFQDRQFAYRFFVDNIFFQNLSLSSLTLEGKWKNHVWYFDHLLWKDFSSSFEIEKKGSQYELHDFSLADGKDLNIHMEGFFRENKFQGEIKDVVICLEQCQKQISQFLNLPYKVEGTVKGGGCVTLGLPSPKHPLQFDADWDVVCENLTIGRLSIECKTPFFIEHSIEDGIMFQGLDLAFRSEDYDLSGINLKVHHLQYQLDQEKWFFSETQVQLPCEIFRTLTQARFFREIPPLEEFMLMLSHSCHFEHPLDVETNIECSSDFSYSKAVAKEGDFSVNGKIRHFKDLSFSFCPTSSEIDFSILYGDRYFTLDNIINWTGPFYINTRLYEKQSPKDEGITMTWSWDDRWGLRIATLVGDLCGLSAAFYEEEQVNLSDPPSMIGSLKMDFTKLTSLLPKEIEAFLSKIKLGKGFELTGRLKQTPEETEFVGSLIAKKFDVAGYEFKTLFSKVQYCLDQVVLEDFEVSDGAGLLSIPYMSFSENQNFFIPLIQVKELRPSLLKKASGETQEISPLVVREMKLEDLRGNLHDKRSLTGLGSLQFINTFKRDYSVMDIPSEVIGRLVGLDLELLMPVRGIIDYELKDGKCKITKIKKTYSEGKRSKFFLVEGDHPYIDFDGKINLHIQMKQYVLFKLTENFILSLEGKLENPHFTMKKKKSFYSLLGN